jgi:hypothetical protein
MLHTPSRSHNLDHESCRTTADCVTMHAPRQPARSLACGTSVTFSSYGHCTRDRRCTSSTLRELLCDNVPIAPENQARSAACVRIAGTTTAAVEWTSTARRDRVFCISPECTHSEVTSGYTRASTPLGFYGAPEVCACSTMSCMIRTLMRELARAAPSKLRRFCRWRHPSFDCTTKTYWPAMD